MKKISVVMTGILVFLSLIKVSAQQTTTASLIQPFHLAITFNKTTNLVFPYAIKSVDRGSRDVLVQKALGVENVLQVKAAKMGFTETNLTVVTADGSLYPYILDYSDSPANFSYVFTDKSITAQAVAMFAKDATTDDIRKYSEAVNAKERSIKGVKDEQGSVALDLKGIYIHNEAIYFQLFLKNNSIASYDVQSLRFYIQDKKRIKRTAEQQLDIQPLYISGNCSLVPGTSEQTITVALPKFTIPDKKFLAVELMEKNGGRHLMLRIKNKLLIRSGKPL